MMGWLGILLSLLQDVLLVALFLIEFLNVVSFSIIFKEDFFFLSLASYLRQKLEGYTINNKYLQTTNKNTGGLITTNCRYKTSKEAELAAYSLRKNHLRFLKCSLVNLDQLEMLLSYHKSSSLCDSSQGTSLLGATTLFISKPFKIKKYSNVCVYLQDTS